MTAEIRYTKGNQLKFKVERNSWQSLMTDRGEIQIVGTKKGFRTSEGVISGFFNFVTGFLFCHEYKDGESMGVIGSEGGELKIIAIAE